MVLFPENLAESLKLRILRNLAQRREQRSGEKKDPGAQDLSGNEIHLERNAPARISATDWHILLAGLDQAGKFVNLGGELPPLPSRYPWPMRWMLRCLGPMFRGFSRYFLAEQREFNSAVLSCLHSFRVVLAKLEHDSLHSTLNREGPVIPLGLVQPSEAKNSFLEGNSASEYHHAS